MTGSLEKSQTKIDDGVSCYCSASHCSTDDSTREALHSDSGADLSEVSPDPDWEDYWAKHGETIIWESWLERYGEYVDPSYLKENKNYGGVDYIREGNHDSSDTTRLSFGSEVSDSLTNVTPLTLSELSTEESSILSSSDSAGSVSTDAAQWQALWVHHFNTQYQIAYENYRTGFKRSDDQTKQYIEDKLNNKKLDTFIYNKTGTYSSECTKKISSGKEFSIGHLLNELRSISVSEGDQLINNLDDVKRTSIVGQGIINKEINLSEEKGSEEISSTTQEEDENCENARSGESFSCSTLENSNLTESVDETEQIKSVSCDVTPDVRSKLKRTHEKGGDRLKNAFNLIGLSYHGKGVNNGSVYYKKRNIRWQNRMLHMNTHIYFDDDGLVLNKDKKTDCKPGIREKYQLTSSCETKSDFSEKDDNSSEGEFFSASEENDVRKERRKRKRRRKGLPREILDNERLLKYWYQRYRLFSKFDEGIKLDEESWYSVSPEKVSRHTADRCRCDVIVDACCGAGGNTIQFAFTCERVIAIDIDPHKIELARHNATIYGVKDRIEFIVGDFVKLAPTLQADVIFLSPPWGGLDYSTHKTYNLENILAPIGGASLYKIAANITPNVAMYLPKNVNSDELMTLVGPGGSLELEQNFLGKKLIAVTAYFGELVGSCNETS